MIEIKDISGKTRFSTSINKGAKGKFTLMKEDYIILPFSVSEPIPFKLGDYVDLAGVLDESLGGKMSKIYEITDIQKPTYNTSTGGYDYNLQMNAYYWKWKNKIFKYTPENAGSEASWSLTASLDVQLGVFLRNLKALGYTYRGQDFEFEIDSTVENKAVAMTYDNINLLDALFSMAGEDQWNCDCWITDNVIHFGRCEFGDAVKIERDVEAASITRSDSQGTYATRIYAFGGTKNIPSNYGKKFIDSVSFIQGDVRFTGLLHNTNYYLNDGADVQVRFLTGADENKIFSVRWTAGNFYFQNEDVCNDSVGDRFELLNFSDNVPDRYLTYGTEDLVVNGVVQKRLMMPADTPYIDVYPDMTQEEAIEGIVVFDDIYPKRVGTMSEVNTVPCDIKEDDKVVGTFDAYQFKDSGFVFDKKYQIEGTDLKIIFQSGKMNGMEFGVIFDPDDKDEQLWEVVRSEDYGRPLPDEYIHPENGDQYVLSGFNIKLVSDQYIPNAQQELKERARKYADKVKIDDGTYPTTLRSDWVKEDLISRTFDFGQRINLVDDTFFENGRISRVLGWEMSLDIPWDSPVYTIGESMPYSRIEEIEDKVDSLVFNGQTYTGIYGSGGSKIYVIKTNDSTSASDSNVFSALRSLATFLRKDKEDSTKYLLTLLAGAIFGENKASIGADGAAQFLSAVFNGGKASISSDGAAKLLSAIFNGGKASIASDGAAVLLSAIFNGGKAKVDSDGAAKFLSILLGTGIETENFSTGALGAGFCLKKDENGDTYLEVDRMLVRKVATFIELLIQRLRYVGGQIILTPASMSCIKVEDKGTYYRCYFSNTDGTKTIKQEFVVGDQARSQTFNIKEGVNQNVSNTYYWRLVVGVGDDYIDLSKADCDAGSTVPQVGDDIVQLGNRTETDRQAAIVLAAYGNDAPYIKMYRGINSYVLDGKEFVTISRTKVNITADSLKFATGENVKDEINKVVTSANEAVISANNAIASANEANQKAEEAKNRLDSWAADGVISPTEKQSLKDEIVRIDADKTQIKNGYAKYGLGTPTSYNNAYNSYHAALVALSQDTPENITIPATFSATQNEYYNQRTLALTAISNAAKDAIDDVESDFNGKIDEVNSSITQTKDKITLEVNSVKSDLATFKEETNTQFSVQDGKITSAVTESKEYADSAVDSIQVGGRNLLIGTNRGKENWKPNTSNGKTHSYSEELRNVNSVKIEVEEVDTKWHVILYKIGSSIKNLTKGGTYTISFDILSDVSTSINASIKYTTGINQIVYFGQQKVTANEWTKIILTGTLGGEDSYYTESQYIYLGGFNHVGTYYIQNLKLEKGNKATAWTAAPEDNIDQILQGSVGNYILNSAFGNGTSNWVAQGSLVISVDTETHHQAGVNTLKVVQSAAANTALTGTRVYQEATKLNPASLSFWVKASKETQFKVRLGGDESYTKTISIGTEWQRVKIEDATPSTNAVVFGALSACTWWLSELILTNTTTAYNWQPSNKDVVKRIEDNSSKIEQLPDQITLQVKKEITTGGLNYIANTQGEVVAEGQNKGNQIITGGWKIHPSIAGKKYGAAFKIKFEGCTFRDSSFVCLQAYNDGGWGYNGLTARTYGLENKEYVIYRNTNTAPSSLTGYGSIQIRVDYVSGGLITISEIRAYDVPEGLVGAFPWYPSKWDTEVLSSEIKQTADSITSTVKKEIGDITIGGDNCISNSDFSNGTSGWSYSSATISAQDYSTHVLGINILRVVQASASDSNLDSIRIFQYAGISVGDTVSFSCWVKASIATKIKIRLCAGSDNLKEFSVDTSWTYITFENVTASSTALIMGATSACTWYLSEPMLVKANKATSWAKKLSEQRNEISTIKQTSNSISLKVDQIGDGLSATGIDITNKKIDITADKLRINTNSGKSVAVFDGTGDVPKLKADYIDAKDLSVSKIYADSDNAPKQIVVDADEAYIRAFDQNTYNALNPTNMYIRPKISGTSSNDYKSYTSIEMTGYEKSTTSGHTGQINATLTNMQLMLEHTGSQYRGLITPSYMKVGAYSTYASQTKSLAVGCKGTEVRQGSTFYKGADGAITVGTTMYWFKDGIFVGTSSSSSPKPPTSSEIYVD